MTEFAHGSRSKLTERDVPRFASESLFDRIARAVCRADCLPRKELYEAWEVARRVRRKVRGGRVLDLACGHGLLAHIMLLLDDTSASALAVDTRIPQSAHALSAELVRTWPRLASRIEFRSAPIESVAAQAADLIVSVHACGALTDKVLSVALNAGAAIAVLPCCQDARICDAGPIAGWLDRPLAIDVMRAQRLAAAGYSVATQTIPAEITPKNRLLIGLPQRSPI
ncbi:MAG: methyltransferase [Sandaracinaceae bacterium]|nr:methyltransferase [Sandaracinaceae bacterium]